MKLIILTQYYPPEIGAPQRRLSELVERFVKAGHTVTVLTAMPNYPRGKIYEGYGGLFRREKLNGVTILRTAIYPTQKASFVHRLTNYFSFVFSSLLFGTFLLPRSDYLMVESPPLFLGFSAIWLGWVKRARLVFNVSDLWPESAVHLGIVRENSLSHRLSTWLERRCYESAWLISGQSNGILGDIRSRFPHKQTFHLSNGVDVSQFGPQLANEALRSQLRGEAETVAIYAGLHGLAQGLDQLLEAAELLQKEQGPRIVLIGDGPEKHQLVQEASRRGLGNIDFWDPVPASGVAPLLASADILLITLKSYIPGAVPSKLYEAMASGKPVIIVASGEPADIVVRHDAGISVKPGDVAALADALRLLSDDSELRKQLGENGRLAAEEFFNRDTIVAGLIEHLENAAQ